MCKRRPAYMRSLLLLNRAGSGFGEGALALPRDCSRLTDLGSREAHSLRVR